MQRTGIGVLLVESLREPMAEHQLLLAAPRNADRRRSRALRWQELPWWRIKQFDLCPRIRRSSLWYTMLPSCQAIHVLTSNVLSLVLASVPGSFHRHDRFALPSGICDFGESRSRPTHHITSDMRCEKCGDSTIAWIAVLATVSGLIAFFVVASVAPCNPCGPLARCGDAVCASVKRRCCPRKTIGEEPSAPVGKDGQNKRTFWQRFGTKLKLMLRLVNSMHTQVTPNHAHGGLTRRHARRDKAERSVRNKA